MEHMSINDRCRARAVLAARWYCGNDYRGAGLGGGLGCLDISFAFDHTVHQGGVEETQS